MGGKSLHRSPCEWRMPVPWGENCKRETRCVSARSREQLAGVCSYAESPPEPHQAPCGCSFMCIHRNIRLPTDIGAIFLRSLKFDMWWQLHLQWHTAGKFMQRYNCSARHCATKRNEWDNNNKKKQPWHFWPGLHSWFTLRMSFGSRIEFKDKNELIIGRWNHYLITIFQFY